MYTFKRCGKQEGRIKKRNSEVVKNEMKLGWKLAGSLFFNVSFRCENHAESDARVAHHDATASCHLIERNDPRPRPFCQGKKDHKRTIVF